MSVPANHTIDSLVLRPQPARIALAAAQKAPYSQSLELGRLVLDDDVAANGETWFLGQVFRLAALKGLRGVVSFSDPVPRQMPDGTIIMPGHVGGVYQAKGAIYTGRGTPRTLVILRDGTVVSARAMQKVRSKDQGHEYLERLLVTHGARPPRAGENPAGWLARALDDAGARRLRHRGCHRYAFPIGTTRRERQAVHVAIPGEVYPKVPDLEEAA